MIDYKTVLLSDIMPQNLLADDNVRMCCDAIDVELKKLAEACKETLIISRIDELSEDVVDLLAWQWHVDFYEESLPIDTKRKLLKKAIDWHRHKGTKYAVEEVVSAVFDEAEVQEWWEYGGLPYHFKIANIRSGMPTGADLDRLVRVVNSTKNTRSWMDDLDFDRKAYGDMYIGGFTSVHKTVNAGIRNVQDTELLSNVYIGGMVSVERLISAGLSKAESVDVEGDMFTGGSTTVYRSIST